MFVQFKDMYANKVFIKHDRITAIEAVFKRDEKLRLIPYSKIYFGSESICVLDTTDEILKIIHSCETEQK